MFTYMLLRGGPAVNAAGSVTAHNRVRASNSDGLIVSGFAPAFCSVTGVEAAQNKSDNTVAKELAFTMLRRPKSMTTCRE